MAGPELVPRVSLEGAQGVDTELGAAITRGGPRQKSLTDLEQQLSRVPGWGVRAPVAQAVGIGAAPRLCGQAKDFMYLISFKFKLSTYFKRKVWGKPPPNPKNFALQVRILQQLHFFMIQRHPSEKKIMVLGKSASAESVCGSWGSVKYSLKLRGRCKDP